MVFLGSGQEEPAARQRAHETVDFQHGERAHDLSDPVFPAHRLVRQEGFSLRKRAVKRGGLCVETGEDLLPAVRRGGFRFFLPVFREEGETEGPFFLFFAFLAVFPGRILRKRGRGLPTFLFSEQGARIEAVDRQRSLRLLRAAGAGGGNADPVRISYER